MRFSLRLSRNLGIPINELNERIDSETLSLYLAGERVDPMDDPFFLSGMTNYWIARTGMVFNSGIKTKDFIVDRTKAKTVSADTFKNLLNGAIG